MASGETVLTPPIKGYWTIYNPPGHPVLAYDFLATDQNKSLYNNGGFLRHFFSQIPASDTYTWSQPVYAPIEGKVVAALDTVPDRQRISFAYDLLTLLIRQPKMTQGFGAFGGNHVMIEANGVFVLLCHLKAGSLKVKVGDKIQVGQLLGEVGNSGSSIQPHLHVQVMRNDRYFPLFHNLLPFKFSHAKVKDGNSWVDRNNLNLSNRTQYLFS